jgi:uncharacterized membrane protein
LNEERRHLLILLALAALYDALFTFPPIMMHLGMNPDLLYRFFQPVCDQLDGRSFHLFGYKMAVCSRCASIYYGATLGIGLYPFFRPLRNTQIPRLVYFLIPLAALVADFSVNYLGIGQNTFASRSITGGIFGISLAFFLVPVWISLLKEFKTRRLLQHEE